MLQSWPCIPQSWSNLCQSWSKNMTYMQYPCSENGPGTPSSCDPYTPAISIIASLQKVSFVLSSLTNSITHCILNLKDIWQVFESKCSLFAFSEHLKQSFQCTSAAPTCMHHRICHLFPVVRGVTQTYNCLAARPWALCRNFRCHAGTIQPVWRCIGPTIDNHDASSWQLWSPHMTIVIFPMAIVTYRESTLCHGEVVILSWEFRLRECACARPCHILGLLEHGFGIISLLQASFFFCLHCNHKNCVSLPCHGVSFVDLHWCSKVAKLPFLANLVALFIFEAPFLWSLSMSDSFSTDSCCWYMGAVNSSSMNFQTLFMLYNMSGIFGASGTIVVLNVYNNHDQLRRSIVICTMTIMIICHVNRDPLLTKYIGDHRRF